MHTKERFLIMYNSYVLRRTNDGIYTFDRINPEEAVYCAVFKDKIFDFSLTDYSGLKERIINVLSTLKEREKETLLYRFGFHNKFYTIKEVS